MLEIPALREYRKKDHKFKAISVHNELEASLDYKIPCLKIVKELFFLKNF